MSPRSVDGARMALAGGDGGVAAGLLVAVACFQATRYLSKKNPESSGGVRLDSPEP